MTNEALRFLALNAVLHGYPAVSGFEDDIERMADCLELTADAATHINNELVMLPDTPVSESAMVTVFLNFFRNQSYPFVAMGHNIFPLSKFMMTDIEGQVSPELRTLFLDKLLSDVSVDEMYVEPFIRDGVLYANAKDFATVQNAIPKAYQLYLNGPEGAPKLLVARLRKHTSLDFYNRLSASALSSIFRQMIRARRKPTIYQHTVLSTPNLLEVYKHTGCIMSFSDTTHTSVQWLLDDANAEDSTLVATVEMAKLKNYLLRDVRDLAGIKAVRGAGETCRVLFAEV